jgi:hypothetical protein
MRPDKSARPRTRRAVALLAVSTCSGLLAAGALVPMGHAAAAAAPVSAGPDAAGVTWLCRPGQAGDPCLYPRGANAVAANGAKTAVPAAPASQSAFDCFYVYPTVTASAATANTGTAVTPALEGAAVSQASRFSQVCNVWAPTYRQRTSASLATGLGNDPAADEVSYESLLAGWKDYLAHDNDGRPIVFLGHSQGAAMLIRLLRSQIDPNARLRRRMVAAIILGGNVQVPIGRTVGGSFRNIPTCTSPRATGCVIAYSTFGSRPPSTSNFGRPGQGVSLQSGQRASRGQRVACVNPVTFSSASGSLLPYFLSVTSPVPGVTVSTPWVSFPGLYTARCRSQGGATWLQVTPTAVPGDPRPTVTAALGPNWGYHLDDVNLALGNLVPDVAREEAAYNG